MSKNQLPMAIKPSTTPKQHILTNLLNCFTFVDVEKQLVIAAPIFLHLGYDEESAEMVLSQPMVQQYTNCAGFTPRETSFIRIAQIGELIVNAPKTKYVAHILEFVKNTLMPLFKSQQQTQAQINSDFSQEITFNPVNANQPLTMSSLEIATMCDKEHRNVMADIKNMFEQLDISSADFSAVYKASNGKMNPCFNLDKEMSLTLVTGYNVTLRHKIIKRWQELENQLTGGMPQISAQPVAVAPAPTRGLPSAKDLALMVIKSEEEKESLLIDYNFLSDTLCQTIREKSAISSKREASVMGKLARANDKIRRLEAQDVLDLDGEKLSLMQIANKLNVAPNAIAAVVAHLGILGLSALGEARCVGKNNGKDVRDWFYNPMAVILIQQNLERGKLL
ncbi:MAG: Rha family transcriptional regulator [Burkholderiales bacterium]|nr:Rha family transcriptional regulator [Burkholderiales bacterium]